MNARFYVVKKPNGKFAVESENETFPEMDSEAAAEMCCQQLNYEPGRNACDVFAQGRWATRKDKAA